MLGRHVRFHFEKHSLLFANASAELAEKRRITKDLPRRNQLLNGDDWNSVLIAKFQKLWQSEQLSVVADYFSNQTDRLQASHGEQRNCCLSVAGTLHQASRGCPERKNMARTDEVLCGGVRVG